MPELSAGDLARREVLRLLAPGTALRDGLERVLRGNTGALVLLGTDRATDTVISGGFPLNVPFSATRLRELAKMDGAIVVDADVATILSANVQLLPDPTIPTDETGTRHRTADRMSKQTGYPVISVSKSMNIIALYTDGVRHVIEDSSTILRRANQAVATLERYKMRLDEVQRNLSALEVEDLVTIRDVASVAQRTQMVLRIAREIEDYVIELGTDGRLISLQLEELMVGVAGEHEMILLDYTPTKIGRRNRSAAQAAADLDALDSTQLLDLAAIAAAIGFPNAPDLLEQPISARGYGLLARVPRIPESISERIIAHFKSVKDLLAASIDDLQAVEGVGDTRARSIRDGLSRIAESTLLDRFS